MTTAGTSAAAPAPPATSGALQAATAQATRQLEAVEKIRSRADTAAKSLLGVGGVALGALGITTATDLVPQYLAGSTWVAVGAVIAGAVFVGVSIGWLSRRLWRVNTPVVTTSNLEETLAELPDREEKLLVSDVYGDMARLNDAPSLQAYEARAWRLARIAERADDERRTALLAQADLVRAEVRATQARAAMLVVRHRATKVITDRRATRIAGLFLAGLVALTGGAGFLADARFDAQIATAKACADARTAISKSEVATNLPERCGAAAPASTPAPAPGVAEATVAETRRIQTVLADAVRTCFADPAQPREVCRARLDDLNRVGASG